MKTNRRLAGHLRKQDKRFCNQKMKKAMIAGHGRSSCCATAARSAANLSRDSAGLDRIGVLVTERMSDEDRLRFEEQNVAVLVANSVDDVP